MTPPPAGNDRVNRETFETELQQLVSHARDDGARLDGVYNVRTPRRDVPDYTIEITEQTKVFPDGGTEPAPTNLPSSTGATNRRTIQRNAIDRFLLSPL